MPKTTVHSEVLAGIIARLEKLGLATNKHKLANDKIVVRLLRFSDGRNCVGSGEDFHTALLDAIANGIVKGFVPADFLEPATITSGGAA